MSHLRSYVLDEIEKFLLYSCWVGTLGGSDNEPPQLSGQMKIISLQIFALITVSTTIFALRAFAVPVEFTQHFPDGFDVSINDGPFSASGPITVTGVVDDSTPDIDPSLSRGEFPLDSVTFTGAGFVDKTVSTPLSLLISSSHREIFAFQLVGQFNEGIMGWDDLTPPGTIITNPNDLSSLTTLPFTQFGTGTFWHQALGGNAWDLGGDTIGAKLGGGGPTGIFSINYVPEPSTSALALTSILLFAHRRRRVCYYRYGVKSNQVPKYWRSYRPTAGMANY